LHDINFFILSL
jgi:hypothetical protein